MKKLQLFALGALAAYTIPLAAQHIEKDGFVEIEAESFVQQSQDEVRKWYVIKETTSTEGLRDLDENHAFSASGKTYIELLPDTRVDHSEKLIAGENFSNDPGKLAVLTYKVRFETPGKYIVWVQAYSTGSEDNGIHVGINGQWPESGRRMQWCEGKNAWTWSSAQRVDHNHCGYPKTIFLNVPSAGLHDINISMREDGVELDRLILVNDKDFEPEGFEMPNELAAFEERVSNNGTIRLAFEEIEVEGRIPFYQDLQRSAYAINAGEVSARDGFAIAQTTFKHTEGKYNFLLKTLGEIDGESTYRILINDKVIGEYQNKPTEKDYNPNTFKVENVELKDGDIIAVEACAHTNGKIPEGDATAWARGRWQSLTIVPVGSPSNGH